MVRMFSLWGLDGVLETREGLFMPMQHVDGHTAHMHVCI